MQVTYPSRSISDLNYFDFSQKAYENLEVGRKINSDGSKWRVIEVLNNPHENGIQAIVVAPIVKKEMDFSPHDIYKDTDTSKVVVAFRGTETLKGDGDIAADWNQVFLGGKYTHKTEVIDGQLIKTSSEETQFSFSSNTRSLKSTVSDTPSSLKLLNHSSTLALQ